VKQEHGLISPKIANTLLWESRKQTGFKKLNPNFILLNDCMPKVYKEVKIIFAHFCKTELVTN
jgi:hypothetical protein